MPRLPHQHRIDGPPATATRPLQTGSNSGELDGISAQLPAPESDQRTHDEAPGKSQRLPWIDILRGLATVLVLSLHASLLTERFQEEPWEPLLHFNNLFSPYRMALLMLLSGFLLARSLEKAPLEYISRKNATLFYPYALWTAFYAIAVHPGGIFDWSLWKGGTYLWFILFLFSYYMVALLLKPISLSIVIPVVFALSFVSPEDTKYYERYFFLMGFFFVGSYLDRNRRALEMITSRTFMMFAVPTSVVFSLLSATFGPINYKIEYFLPTIAGIGVLVWLARRHRLMLAPLAFIGRHSVVFFVIHYPVIHFVMALGLTQDRVSVRDVTALSFAIALCVCWIAAVVREKVVLSEYLYSVPISKH